MSIKHSELEIEPGKPFANCKLDRQKNAKVLTGIINAYPNGFVLAINNKWGTGKTTFVKMWEQDLKDNLYQTVYFNAWENDFENNPLTALMGELKSLTTTETEPKFKTALKNAATLSKHLVPIIAKAIADKYVNSDSIKDAIDGISKGVTDIFENDVNEYAEKKKGISEFRKSISEFIANTNNGKPLIFIVDELDRCRPNYAVSILEQIKHFFSVPNIVFVLSIDKVQLGNAIRGVYGSDRIDSDEYLKRFIDIEYTIPAPEKGTYYKYLYQYFEFDAFFKSHKRIEYRDLQEDSYQFLKISELLFDETTISLRQQEKIFAHARLALRSFEVNTYVIPIVYLLITYIKVIYEDLYDDIKNKNLTITQLQEKFAFIFRAKRTKEKETELMWLEAYLLLYYNNYLNTPYERNSLYETNGTHNILKIESIINPLKNAELLKILENIDGRGNAGRLDIGHFIKKIELTDAILI